MILSGILLLLLFFFFCSLWSTGKSSLFFNFPISLIKLRMVYPDFLRMVYPDFFSLIFPNEENSLLFLKKKLIVRGCEHSIILASTHDCASRDTPPPPLREWLLAKTQCHATCPVQSTQSLLVIGSCSCQSNRGTFTLCPYVRKKR